MTVPKEGYGRGLFLDLDGTLADSLGLMREIYGSFLRKFDIVGTDAEFSELNGPPIEVVIQILKQRHALAGTEEALYSQYMGLVRQSYLGARPSLGALELLTFAWESGWKCAVVTSNSESLTRMWLDHHGLSWAISEVIGKESVKAGKPDPEPYLLALARTGCAAIASSAIEDSAAGVASALGARLRTFAYLPHPQSGRKLFPENTQTIHRLLDVKEHLANA